MNEGEKTTKSQLNILKYFLIITGAVFIIRAITDHVYLGSINGILGSFNILNLPLFNSYTYPLLELIWNLFGSVYWVIWSAVGFGIHFMIAYIIDSNINISNKESSISNEESSSNILTIKNIITNSFMIANNNFGVILGASILWVLTIWVPYLNVGTTIGMWALVVELGKGDTSFSPTSIFSSKYRKYMGEVFLLLGFIILGTTIGYSFLIIPGLVLTIAWGQSVYILIDKDLTPLQAIKMSNSITYGEKLTIFLGYIALFVILSIPIFLITILFINIELFSFVPVFVFTAYIFAFTVMVASAIYIYSELSKKNN